MRTMSQVGNDLYTGKTSFPFVGRRRLWFLIAAILVIGSALVPLFRPIQFSIEFTGGSQFTVSGVSETDQLDRDRGRALGRPRRHDEGRDGRHRHGPRADGPDDGCRDPRGHRRAGRGIRRSRRPGERLVHRSQLGRRRDAPVAVGSRDLPRTDLHHPGAVLPHVEDVGLGDHRPGRRARHHDRRVRAVRLRDLACRRHRIPDDPLLRAVRHDGRVRQDPREYERRRRSVRAGRSASR